MYPSLRGQPLFDFLHKESLYDKLNLWNDVRHSQEQIVTPTLPNRFLAVVPEWLAQQLAVAAEKAMREELQRIGDACAKWLKVEDTALARWNQQLRQFLNVTWQTWTWETDVAKAVAEHPALKPDYAAAIQGIPEEHLDPRNYRHQSRRESDPWRSEIIPGDDGKPVIDNPGFAWAAMTLTRRFASIMICATVPSPAGEYRVWKRLTHALGTVAPAGRSALIQCPPTHMRLPLCTVTGPSIAHSRIRSKFPATVYSIPAHR